MARRTRQISLKECYDILQLQKGADLQAVKTAYRRRAFELHPDLHPGDPEAGRQFQLLNEAYVALSAMLKPAEEAKKNAQKEQPDHKAQNAAQEEEAQSRESRSQEAQSEAAGAENAAKSDASRASAAYAEQDVLRDLLNDPFARRVFEDIYSELGRQETAAPEPPPTSGPTPPKPEKKPARSKEPRVIKPVPLWERGQEKGVKGVVKDWLRRQIDEEQSLTMPAARLRPGSKIRLQIRKGMSEEVNAVDVTLPRDFVVGKPMRLRGLGKKVGPWQGDLYLTIYTE